MKIVLRLLLLIIGSGLPLLASAQQDPGAALRQIQDTQRREQERQQRDLDALRQRNDKPSGIDTRELAPKTAAPSAETTCRQIDEITIEDAPHLSDHARAAIVQQFAKRCLGVNEIEQLLGEVTRVYLQRGYIAARAYLPAQDLSSRKLRIVVVEGKVGKISIEDNGARSVSKRNIFPGVEGDILNLRDLEQGIEQINRLSSNNASMEIVPGADAGISDVVVHNQPTAPYHLFLSLDNQGTKSTGKNQAAASGYFDNLLGSDDMLSGTHRESVFGDGHGERSESNTFNASVPYGYFSFSYGLSYSTYESTVTPQSGLDQIASGSTRTHNALADYVAYRDQDSRVSFSVGLTNKDTKSYFADQFLAVSSRVLTILDIDSNVSTALAGGLVRANIGYARGLNALGALDDPASLPSDAPRAQFEKYKYALSYSYPFIWGELPWSASSGVTGQHAVNSLYGSEQILIGGNYSVRGFVDNTLSGDNGYYWHNDLSVQPNFTLGSEAFGSRFYVGVDYGEVSSYAADTPEGHLSGWGFGGELHWRGATFEVFNTRPISMPSSMQREGSQTWVRLSYSL
ncbi:MAG TPA: ShlB/FhaC/HecB family hemolysin secretion/activation protein [Spongiibacteraceae bacterium]|nr:ShlB/FhaC/HecB family hemolysin secretion/activation protein [Spongiibacteraceae bacterium]